MKPPFKQTQRFDWENEPAGERPSEFVPSSGYSVLSGYHAIGAPIRHRRASRGRFGFTTWALFTVAVLTLGAWAMSALAPLLRS